MQTALLQIVSAFVASAAFAVIMRIRGVGILTCGLGGSIGWTAFLLAGLVLDGDIMPTLIAAVAVSAYAEVMARIRRCPVTGYLLVAIIPFVPGGGIYYTMEYALAGESEAALSSLLHTLGLAGSLAVGVLIVSSAVRLILAAGGKKREGSGAA